MQNIDPKNVELIRKSGYFDEKFYLMEYPDVAILGMDPIEHYLWIGAEMFRNPSHNFHTAAYLEANVDVARAKLNPLLHFMGIGRKEVRSPALQENSGQRSAPDTDAVFIESGPFRIKRQYRDYDFSREAHFLEQTGRLYESGQEKFDEVLVSIVMPTYNRASIIRNSIQSVLNQDHQNWRLIIVDDGSEDNTAQVISPFLKDERIEYVEKNHVGVSGARNAGILRSSGQYLAYLDSDNAWNPKFLRTMVVFMEAAELDAAYSSLHSSDEKGHTVCYRGDIFVWSACLKSNYIDLNPFMHRRDLIYRRGSPDVFDINLRRFVDWDFILRITRDVRVSYAPFIGVEYYDGQIGGRITRTEYQGDESAVPIAAVRAKHEVSNGELAAIDTGAGVAFSARPIGEIDLSYLYTLRYFPDYTINNAYQNLLYEPMVSIDAAPGDIDTCISLVSRSESEDTRVVFHLHWTNPIFANGVSEADAAQRANDFVAKLRLFRAQGGRVIWTIHNVISHEPKYLDVELDLHRTLANLADWIHVHHLAVVEDARPYYTLPSEKVLVAAHGNYIGTLNTEITRAEARERLGIPLHATVFLFLGQIRSYKGVDELIDTFNELSSQHDNVWLVMAGKLLGVSQQEIAVRLGSHGRAVFRPGYVADEDMQTYLNSANAMVLPYRKVSTSGSALLAMSFALPVICPASGLLSYLIDDGKEGLLYHPDEQGGLRAAMERFLVFTPAERREMSEFASAAARVHNWEESASALQRYMEALDFGRMERPDINGSSRRWFVRGERDTLKGKRCIAIILHYQNLDDTRECIDRIAMQSPDVGLIVISNNEALSDIRQLAREYPDLFLVQAEDNVGYAAANNFGLWVCRELGSEFFWIINPDIVVPPGYFGELVERVEDWPDNDFFGTTIVPSHDPNKVLFCGGKVRLDSGAAPAHMFMGAQLEELPGGPFECDYLTGANIVGRTSALAKAGYMPEEYFLYFEETDWFLQMFYAAGLPKPLVFPDLVVKNHKRSENGLIPSRYYIYYFVRNSLLFGRKFAPDQIAASEIEARKFANAWLDKIARAAPARVQEFELLIERAFADGRKGKAGRAAFQILSDKTGGHDG